ncbi:hypothetical protein ACWGB8_20030, partial [Kitasatospora sp. NPDC054939]
MDPLTTPDGRTLVHVVLTNGGPRRTASAVTLVVTLPEGMTAEGPFAPKNCYPFQNGHRVRCTFDAGLFPGGLARALVPARPTDGAGARVAPAEGWAAIRSADDRNEANNKVPFYVGGGRHGLPG